MSDQALRRADELLTELVDIIETARAVPMSSSCVIGREHVLDILDDLRDVMPPEMSEARRLVAQRDDLLRSASEHESNARSDAEKLVTESREQATSAADNVVSQARIQAEELLTQAHAEAFAIVEAARVEHVRLVSSTTLHHAATVQADQMRNETLEFVASTRSQAEADSASVRSAAAQAANTLRADSEVYAENTLSDLLTVLGKASKTAEQGRVALIARRGRADPAATTAAHAGTEPSESSILSEFDTTRISPDLPETSAAEAPVAGVEQH